ncbi:MAG: zinc ribbon domain-containing protein [Flavobacteriales bacterium]|nr:zinc ribbon domain-containing protein [Flavobacteriales bacterium]
MFCSSCGNKLKESDNFCSSCGQKSTKNTIKTDFKEKLETFEFSSNILLGGNILTPDRLVITDNEVIYKKRNKYLIGVDESSIPFSRISSIEIDRKLIDSDILIYSTGNQQLKVEDFSVGDAKKIKKIIESRLQS